MSTFDLGTLTVSDEIHFRDVQGWALDPEAFDAEEIRVLPNGNLLWSTEGQPDSLNNRAPALIESSPTGVAVAEYVVSVKSCCPGASDQGFASLDFDDEGNLDALQCGYLPEERNRGEIIRIELPAELSPAAEQSTAAQAPPAAPAVPVTPAVEKQALDGSEVPLGRQVGFDLAEGPAFTPGQGHPDNIEGLQATVSPSNPQGVRFDLVSDNNFSDSQRSVIHTLYASEPQ